jgi:hypothetical protein
LPSVRSHDSIITTTFDENGNPLVEKSDDGVDGNIDKVTTYTYECWEDQHANTSKQRQQKKLIQAFLKERGHELPL